MNYKQALTYIHSVSNFFCKPGLERIKILCEKLGNPQDRLKFIHVAGTNGKGSFCAMLSSILSASGLKTGLYTSPYILNFNERIQVDGKEIPNKALADITSKVKKVADKMQDKPTEFELITAIAFEYFAQCDCNIVILECGLGGRFDATNIIKSSVLCVITSVSLDHTSFLGDTIPEIASEKAGIIKSGVPCLNCCKNSEANSVIEATCKEQNAPIYVPKGHAENIKYSLDGTIFDFEDKTNIEIPLLGCYQPSNAVNVLTAVTILNDMGYSISEQSLRDGLKNTVWHARFEIINTVPLIIFDGGHNQEGVSAAVESIKQYLGQTKINVITGVMKDKEFLLIAKKISEIAQNVYCITPNNPRALSSEEFASVFKELNVNVTVAKNISEAINQIKNSKIPTVCLGSLYMYKEIIQVLN